MFSERIILYAEYFDIIARKYGRGELSEEKFDRLTQKIIEWDEQHNRRLISSET